MGGSPEPDVCDPALHIVGLLLIFPVLWKTIFGTIMHKVLRIHVDTLFMDYMKSRS